MQFPVSRRGLIHAGAIAVLLGTMVVPAFPQARSTAPRIVVTGEGEMAVAPDLAILSLTVMREADTAEAAMTDANAAMGAVIAAMKEASVGERDLQTGGLQINPQYNYPSASAGGEPKVSGYQVTNTLVVRVRDLSSLGAIIDRAVKLGVNQGANITFTNDDPSSALTEARKRAVADAISKARTLAEAAGVELGDILRIAEQARQPQPLPIQARAFQADAAAQQAVPIEAGENLYQVNVDITFELNR